uniref:Secreted protein n=1 Tax=Calcidiscus leptoporus TaxID=127549 RepID=A0A7S0NR16_9EUKA
MASPLALSLSLSPSLSLARSQLALVLAGSGDTNHKGGTRPREEGRLSLYPDMCALRNSSALQLLGASAAAAYELSTRRVADGLETRPSACPEPPPRVGVVWSRHKRTRPGQGINRGAARYHI